MRWLHQAEEMLIAVLLGVMVAVTFLQVVLRYGFHSGLIWGLECTLYAWAWLVLLGMSYGVRAGTHIGVDVYVKKFGRATQRRIGLIVAGLCILYAAVMLVGGTGFVTRLYRLNIYAEDLALKRWILTLPLPVGFAMLLGRLVGAGIRIWRGQEASFRIGGESDG